MQYLFFFTFQITIVKNSIWGLGPRLCTVISNIFDVLQRDTLSVRTFKR